jgi:hypothetical protein
MQRGWRAMLLYYCMNGPVYLHVRRLTAAVSTHLSNERVTLHFTRTAVQYPYRRSSKRSSASLHFI